LVDEDVFDIGSVFAHVNLVFTIAIFLSIFLSQYLLDVDVRGLEDLVVLLIHGVLIVFHSVNLLVLIILFLIFLAAIPCLALVLLFVFECFKLIL